MQKKNTFWTRFIPIVCLLVGGIYTSQAQLYDQAAGLRGGTGATISYKKFISEPVAFEAIVGSYNYDYFGVAILVEKHTEMSINRLQWYWGVGPYLTFGNDFTAFGAIGALGLDFSFESIPIQISVDWTPRIRLAGEDARFISRSAGVGIRYIISY